MSSAAFQSPLEYFESARERLVHELIGFVRHETPTCDVERVAAFVAHYRSLLEGVGVECDEVPGPRGPQLVGELLGGDPPIVLVGHSDTVWPVGQIDRRPPEIREGRLYGPGVYDMKGGLGLILWSLRYLAESGFSRRRRILVFISADEEMGSETARPVMVDRLPVPATALVPEPPCPDGSIKIERKGAGIFSLEIFGHEVHAGVEPENGASAVSEAAWMITEIESWTNHERGVSLNIGTVDGGTATNVVPGRARLGIDLRFVRPEDGEEIESRIRALVPKNSRVRLEVGGGLVFPPLRPTPTSLELATRAADIAQRELGISVGAGRTGGGSDGSHLAARGMDVIDGLGIDGAGAHAQHEHVLVDRIPVRAALFTRLLQELDAQ